MTRSWVLATDLVYAYNANTRLTGTNVVTNLGSSASYAVAPGVEYNWTPNIRVLLATRFFPAGHNTSASVTPAIAVNYVR
jgi:hypothetical protein